MRSVLFTCSLLLIAASAFACTGMYAGKGVTTDASVLIGRTADFLPCNATMRQQICERGSQVAFRGLTNQYRYVCVPKSTSLKKGRYAGSAANEKGVILTATITGRTHALALAKDPFVLVKDGGVGEPNLPDYLIGNAATAREAVKLLGDAVGKYGHSFGEIYMVADTNEAWYVEVYTGHQWAAVKMPEDKAAAFGNHFSLRGFDTNDTENVSFSPGLVAYAVTNDFAVWTDETKTKLDLYLTYADRSSVEENYDNFRAYYGHRHFADAKLPKYEKDLLPELFFTPGHKIAPTNMFELMRARYEELSDEELPTARTNAAIRVIGTTKQGGCHVLQLDCRAATPDNMRGTVWSCLGAAEHGVFIPINASQNFLFAAYTNDAQRTFGYDPNRAADAFRRLSALTQSNRECYGPEVRAYWRQNEMRRAEEWPMMLDRAIASGDTKALSHYTFVEEENSFADAKTLYDKLLWRAADDNRPKADGALAGTWFYVGRKVSADGTAMIGRTVDAPPRNGPMLRFERGERKYADGTTNDYAFVCACMVTGLGQGLRGGGAINEKGVMLSATVTGRTREEAPEAEMFVPCAQGSCGERNLPDYLIGKAATAREAVELLGKMIAAHGHAGPEVYMVADADEAWHVEVRAGGRLAAVRMPEDKVTVFGDNHAIKCGLVQAEEKKVTLTEVFELMRETIHQSCHVLQMRHALPADYRCTLWECLAQAEHSTFLPVCMAAKTIPNAYSCDQTGALEYDPKRAADAFLRLGTLAELKRFTVDTNGKRQDVRPCYGAGVRDFWRAQEARLVAEWPQLLEEWASCGESGRSMANAYVNFNQVWTLANAKRLHDELAWYWAKFNCDLRDGKGATDVPTHPFASSMPTNAELGATWTQWHRAEFDAFIEELAGPVASRSPEVEALVLRSKKVFDGVEDEATLAAAKVEMANIVRSVAQRRKARLRQRSPS